MLLYIHQPVFEGEDFESERKYRHSIYWVSCRADAEWCHQLASLSPTLSIGRCEGSEHQSSICSNPAQSLRFAGLALGLALPSILHTHFIPQNLPDSEQFSRSAAPNYDRSGTSSIYRQRQFVGPNGLFCL